MEDELLDLLQQTRDEGDREARAQLNQLLRDDPEARATMATLLVDEQALMTNLREEKMVSLLNGEEARQGKGIATMGGRDRFTWPRQAAAILLGGLFAGLLGAGIAWAVAKPNSEVTLLPIANGDFEADAGADEGGGAIPRGFPVEFGSWRGDPAEVVEDENGNRHLRFLETANVRGVPNGGASACNVFQLVDLAALQEHWEQSAADDLDAQLTLQLSARFRRESAPTDADVPIGKASCTIHLYAAEPESIGENWPLVIREALSVSNKAVKLGVGDDPSSVSASCLLDPEATLALISVNVNAMRPTTVPIPLGGFYVDDVELTLIRQPNLPVRFVR